MGNEISDMLRRRSRSRSAGVRDDSGRAAERVEAVLDVARCSAAGAPPRLGHESVGCRCREVGRERAGLALGEDVDRRARLRPL